MNNNFSEYIINLCGFRFFGGTPCILYSDISTPSTHLRKCFHFQKQFARGVGRVYFNFAKKSLRVYFDLCVHELCFCVCISICVCVFNLCLGVSIRACVIILRVYFNLCLCISICVLCTSICVCVFYFVFVLFDSCLCILFCICVFSICVCVCTSGPPYEWCHRHCTTESITSMSLGQ